MTPALNTSLVVLDACVDYMASYQANDGMCGPFRLYGARVENDGDGQKGPALMKVRSDLLSSAGPREHEPCGSTFPLISIYFFYSF